MKQQFFALARATALALLSLPLWAGCSAKTNTGSTSSASCDSTKCAPGNACISDGKTTKCRLKCPLNPDGTGGQQICPFNYHCVDGPTPYCAADTTSYKDGKGTWGAPCNATGGIDKNPDCDASQQFWCYATSPTDGAAFCTQFQCSTDADCRGGWWCATVNVAPNATQAGRTVGQTATVCLPRTYCSPCASDIDCPQDNGVTQHCVNDSAGGKLCAPECGQDSQCNQEAQCAARDEAGGAKVCVPRAGVCVGDGGLCAPCRSDADCQKGGACAYSSYSTEKFCVLPSGTTCMLDATSHLVSQCSQSEVGGGRVSCTLDANEWPDIPKSFCYGLVPFGPNDPQAGGQQYVPGCYTPKR